MRLRIRTKEYFTTLVTKNNNGEYCRHEELSGGMSNFSYRTGFVIERKGKVPKRNGHSSTELSFLTESSLIEKLDFCDDPIINFLFKEIDICSYRWKYGYLNDDMKSEDKENSRKMAIALPISFTKEKDKYNVCGIDFINKGLSALEYMLMLYAGHIDQYLETNEPKFPLVQILEFDPKLFVSFVLMDALSGNRERSINIAIAKRNEESGIGENIVSLFKPKSEKILKRPCKKLFTYNMYETDISVYHNLKEISIPEALEFYYNVYHKVSTRKKSITFLYNSIVLNETVSSAIKNFVMINPTAYIGGDNKLFAIFAKELINEN